MIKDWTFQLCHTRNMCADFLAKLGTRSTSDLLIVFNPSFVYCLRQIIWVLLIIAASSLFLIFVFALTFSDVNKKKQL